MENQMTFYAPTETERKLFLTRTYLWMGIALLVSAVVSFFAAESGLIISILKATGGMGLIILCIAMHKYNPRMVYRLVSLITNYYGNGQHPHRLSAPPRRTAGAEQLLLYPR